MSPEVRGPGTIGPADLVRNTIQLDYPSPADVETAFFGLPAAGRLLLTCRLAEMSAVLGSLERAGFFGMRVDLSGPDGCTARVTAYKGKEGPCHDTGRTARYMGAAAAALDDDRHLLLGEVRVCQKTAVIYSSPAYAGIVDVTQGDPELLARPETDPVAFDCDTFEDDVAGLASSLTEHRAEKRENIVIFYGGPFRLLILKDGRLLRRGLAVRLDEDTAFRLKKGDGCIELDGELAAGAVPLTDFREGYGREGPVFLLADVPAVPAGEEDVFPGRAPVHLEALLQAPEGMRVRLKRMIERRDEYFVLTGSDPRDEFGCCPSGVVGAANALVEAGVLQAWRPPTPPGSCPVATYAFAGEIGEREKGPGRDHGMARTTWPAFAPDEELRRSVAEHLARADRRGRKLVAAAARWALLLFVIVSVLVAVLGGRGRAPGAGLSSKGFVHADAPQGEVVLVYLFHVAERCDPCDKMEKLTRETLFRSFADEVRRGKILFRKLNMDVPENRHFRRRYGLFTSSVVLVALRDGREERVLPLRDSWSLVESDLKFVDTLRTSLAGLVAGLREGLE